MIFAIFASSMRDWASTVSFDVSRICGPTSNTESRSSRGSTSSPKKSRHCGLQAKSPPTWRPKGCSRMVENQNASETLALPLTTLRALPTRLRVSFTAPAPPPPPASPGAASPAVPGAKSRSEPASRTPPRRARGTGFLGPIRSQGSIGSGVGLAAAVVRRRPARSVERKTRVVGSSRIVQPRSGSLGRRGLGRRRLRLRLGRGGLRFGRRRIFHQRDRDDDGVVLKIPRGVAVMEIRAHPMNDHRQRGEREMQDERDG